MSAPRVAMVAPFPPKKTGIADYSATLAFALRQHVELALFDIGESRALAPDVAVQGMSSAGALVRALEGYDCILYHIGNNPHFHHEIALAMIELPGLAVLHDTALYYLAAGMGAGGLAKALCMERGLEGFRVAAQIRQSCPDGDLLRFQRAADCPCLGWMTRALRAAIVHNRFSAERLRDAGFTGPIDVIPLLAQGPQQRLVGTQRDDLRSELGIAPGEIVIGAFGFVARTKRLDKIAEALSALRDRHAFRLLIVGTGDDVSAELEQHGLTDRAIRLGYVTDEKFSAYLQVTDVLVNLRYPTMGESSSPLSKALAIGMPAIVTDHGPLAELPGEAVIKIPLGDAEVPRLRESFELLLGSAEARSAYAARARAYANEFLAPGVIASRYAEVIREYIAAHGSAPVAEPTDAALAGYAAARLRSAFP